MARVRRVHRRLQCSLVLSILSASGRRLGEGRIADLSLSGASIHAPDGLEKSVSYGFLFEGLHFHGRLRWLGPRDLQRRTRRYGVYFILSVDQEARLRTLLGNMDRQISS